MGDLLILTVLAVLVIVMSWIGGRFAKGPRAMLIDNGEFISISSSGAINSRKIPKIPSFSIKKIEYIEKINPLSALVLGVSAHGYFAALGGDVIKVYYVSGVKLDYFVVTDIERKLLDKFKNNGVLIIGER